MYPSTGIPKRRSSPVDPTNEIVIMLPCDHQNTLEPCFDQISITIKSPSSQQTKKEKSAKSTYSYGTRPELHRGGEGIEPFKIKGLEIETVFREGLGEALSSLGG